ncbi:MAG: hypothetical protein R2839_01910 [Thermomicrobiales bacterium]
MKALFRPVVLVTVLALLMSAPFAMSGPARAQDDGPILIGAPVNLTDWMAAYDIPPLEGAKLAVKQINAAGAFSVVNCRSLNWMAKPTRPPSAMWLGN